MGSLLRMLVEPLGPFAVGAVCGVVETIRPDGTQWRATRRPNGTMERHAVHGTAGLPMTIGWGLALGVLGSTVWIGTGKAPLDLVPGATMVPAALGLKGFAAKGLTAFLAGMILRSMKNIGLGMIAGVLAALGSTRAQLYLQGLFFGATVHEYFEGLDVQGQNREELARELEDLDYRSLGAPIQRAAGEEPSLRILEPEELAKARQLRKR